MIDHLVAGCTEANCRTGGLGLMDSKHLMTVLLANAKRRDKFGA